MFLKTLKPTYSGSDSFEKISMLISYVEDLSDEISFRLEKLSETVEGIKHDIYIEEENGIEST